MKRHSYRVSIPTSDGLTLAGIVDRPADLPVDGTSSVPVAVFSHCFTCSKDLKAIARISRGLSESGIAVLRFDMRGLGGSGGTFSQSSFTTNLVDLAAAIRFATGELGEVTALIGHSFGGAASLATSAGMKPDAADLLDESMRSRLRGVVAIASPSDTVHLAKLLVTMNPAIESAGAGEVSIGGRSWTITDAMVADFRRHALADALPQIGCPVMIFHSPSDRTVAFDHAIRMLGFIHDHDGLPSASLVTLAGSDHLLVDDARDADLVTQMTSAWLHRYAGSADAAT